MHPIRFYRFILFPGIIMLLATSGCQSLAPAPTQTVTSSPPTPASTLAAVVSPQSTDTLMPPTPTDTVIPPTATPTTIVVQTQVAEKDGMMLVYVGAGNFQMGSNTDNTEKPIHTVWLDAFWIDQTDVTNAMYAKCVAAKACKLPETVSSMGPSPSYPVYYGLPKYDHFPVVSVDWKDAAAYCQWAGQQLPTEAQWEKAARGVDGRTYPWGEAIDTTKANYNNAVGNLTAVGSYPDGASPYGALDMVGNVHQWVADWYAAYDGSTQRNPTGPATGAARVVKGGSYYQNDFYMRAAVRGQDSPTDWNPDVGFRCVTAQP